MWFCPFSSWLQSLAHCRHLPFPQTLLWAVLLGSESLWEYAASQQYKEPEDVSYSALHSQSWHRLCRSTEKSRVDSLVAYLHAKLGQLKNPLMNHHPAGWCEILLQFLSCRIELFRLSSSKASAACSVGSRRVFLLWLLDLSQIKTLETAFLKQPVSPQDWNYHLTRMKGWSGETRYRTQLTPGTTEVYIFPAFFIQISMVKGSLTHQGAKAPLCFSISYLSTFPISCSLKAIRKQFRILTSFSWLLCC